MKRTLAMLLLLVLASASALAAPVNVLMKTSLGDVKLELYPDKAPETVKNFLRYLDEGFYDGTLFHRVIGGFMIQGGDPTATGRGGESIWKKPFEDEFKPGVVFDRAGLLAMANAGPNTNGSQFFITVAPTPWLNGHHTIFGEVVEGMDTVRKLELVETNGRYGGDRPIEKVFIRKAYVLHPKF